MTAPNYLKEFLKWAVPAKADRYWGFACSQKNKHKFLSALDHEFENSISPSRVVNSLPSSVQNNFAFLFSARGEFGAELDSMNKFLESFEEAFLLVSSCGKFGVYGPETHIDNRVFLSREEKP